MKNSDYLHILQKDIHSTAIATIGDDGHPQVRIIDIMLADDESIYFITARGKAFYRQIVDQKYIALTGVTDNKRAISLRGTVGKADPALLDKVFEENPYMKDIYPGDTRKALEVFQVYEGQGEYFDLSQTSIFRDSFVLGGVDLEEYGYFITENCTGCGLCDEVCPPKCIDLSNIPAVIQQENCLHCGACFEVCPEDAIIRR